MNKKISTPFAISIIAVFALFIGGIIFICSKSQSSLIPEKNIALAPQKNNPQEIKKSDNQDINQVPKRFSGSGCYEKDKEGYDNFYLLSKDFNLDDSNSKVKYENVEKGISFDIPYNAKWGNNDCKVEAYIHNYKFVEFGKPRAWIPSEFIMTIYPQKSSNDIISELTSLKVEPKIHPIKKKIANKQLVFWESFETLYGVSYELIGEKYNYRFDYTGGAKGDKITQEKMKELEDIISSIKLF
jgi:hypothetical protein